MPNAGTLFFITYLNQTLDTLCNSRSNKIKRTMANFKSVTNKLFLNIGINNIGGNF